MPRWSTAEILRSGRLEDHPAIQAWRVLRPERCEIESLQILQETNKSGVYRIGGAGIGGSAVIAKQYRYENTFAERIVYEEVLPQLPLSRLHYYGFLPSEDQCHWIFVEDAGRERYSPASSEQRMAAARWLGVLHTSAARVAGADGLPDRGPNHYRARLQSARTAVARVLAELPLAGNDRDILESVVAQCDRLRMQWIRIERACASAPRTLVHGDFVRKNVPVRAGSTGPVLLPLDWEHAGWGLPTIDLVTSNVARLTDDPVALSASPEMGVYRSVVGEFWPRCGDDYLTLLTTLGTIFRLIDSVKWACEGLAGERALRVLPLSVSQFRLYLDELARAIQALRGGTPGP
jgi:hypothetical protein